MKLWPSNATAGGSTGFLLSPLIHALAKLLKYTAPAFNCVIPVVGVKTGEGILSNTTMSVKMF